MHQNLTHHRTGRGVKATQTRKPVKVDANPMRQRLIRLGIIRPVDAKCAVCGSLIIQSYCYHCDRPI